MRVRLCVRVLGCMCGCMCMRACVCACVSNHVTLFLPFLTIFTSPHSTREVVGLDNEKRPVLTVSPLLLSPQAYVVMSRAL